MQAYRVLPKPIDPSNVTPIAARQRSPRETSSILSSPPFPISAPVPDASSSLGRLTANVVLAREETSSPFTHIDDTTILDGPADHDNHAESPCLSHFAAFSPTSSVCLSMAASSEILHPVDERSGIRVGPTELRNTFVNKPRHSPAMLSRTSRDPLSPPVSEAEPRSGTARTDPIVHGERVPSTLPREVRSPSPATMLQVDSEQSHRSSRSYTPVTRGYQYNGSALSKPSGSLSNRYVGRESYNPHRSPSHRRNAYKSAHSDYCGCENCRIRKYKKSRRNKLSQSA